MQQMPPLPVRLNVELANNFLPKAVANGCQMPYMAAPIHGECLWSSMQPDSDHSQLMLGTSCCS